MERNNERLALKSVSGNRLQYSWKTGKYRFVSPVRYPGNKWDPDCEWYHYFRDKFSDPRMNLDFVEHDLHEQVGQSGDPVFLLCQSNKEGLSVLEVANDNIESN